MTQKTKIQDIGRRLSDVVFAQNSYVMGKNQRYALCAIINPYMFISSVELVGRTPCDRIVRNCPQSSKN
eukprot:1150147-Amphidinium_carterae.1